MTADPAAIPAHGIFLAFLLTAQTLAGAGTSLADTKENADTIFCEDRGGIVSTRDGRSGRQYKCFALREIRGGRIGNLTIHCDTPGGLTTTENGLSGRRYGCYALSLRDPVRLGANAVFCDQQQGSSTARAGISGYRYDCYVLDRSLLVKVN